MIVLQEQADGLRRAAPATVEQAEGDVGTQREPGLDVVADLDEQLDVVLGRFTSECGSALAEC